MALPFGLLEYVNSPPVLRTCTICGAVLEWNPLAQEWADYISGSRHYCLPEAIAALLPDMHECIHCGGLVLVYQDGRRLNADKTPHRCRQRNYKQQPAKPTPPPPTQRRPQRVYRGSVDI